MSAPPFVARSSAASRTFWYGRFGAGFPDRAAKVHRRAIGHPKAADETRRRAEESLTIAARRPKVIVVREPGKTTFKALPDDAE